MPEIVIASNNAHKVGEVRALLASSSWKVVTPAEAGIQLDPDESGATYAENAVIKAKAFVSATGMPALADDSGLEVDALRGRPGVHSARYGGAASTFDDKIRLLLGELERIPAERRGARFRSIVAIAVKDGRTWLTEGVCEGRISRTPRGSHGFGYDPIFCVSGHGATMAELSDELKNTISHRALAIQKAAQVLEQLRDDPAFR